MGCMMASQTPVNLHTPSSQRALPACWHASSCVPATGLAPLLPQPSPARTFKALGVRSFARKLYSRKGMTGSRSSGSVKRNGSAASGAESGRLDMCLVWEHGTVEHLPSRHVGTAVHQPGPRTLHGMHFCLTPAQPEAKSSLLPTQQMAQRCHTVTNRQQSQLVKQPLKVRLPGMCSSPSQWSMGATKGRRSLKAPGSWQNSTGPQ